MCEYPVVQYTIKHQKYVPVSSCTVHDKTSVICASILAHIYDASSRTVQQGTSTYCCCFVVYCTTRYWHIFLMFHRVLYN
jgi:hypothetical protein